MAEVIVGSADSVGDGGNDHIAEVGPRDADSSAGLFGDVLVERTGSAGKDPGMNLNADGPVVTRD